MRIYLLSAGAKLNHPGPLGANNTSYVSVFTAADDEAACVIALKDLLDAQAKNGFTVSSASLQQIALGVIAGGPVIRLAGPDEWSRSAD